MTGMLSPMKGKELTLYVCDDTADAAVEFGSIEEADMYLAASGFEKGEARRDTSGLSAAKASSTGTS